jgi:hypothetical protein
MTLEEIKRGVIEEIHRAQDKFPWWPMDVVHAAAIVVEEAGELQRAALQFCYENGDGELIKKEALQVAAMVYRLLFYIEEYRPGGSGRFYD